MLSQNIKKAAALLREGKVVAFPTETVYGLGANALNPEAVAKIFELKERPSFDPLIVHIASITQLNDLIKSKDQRVVKLAERFWPGPLTIVLPKSEIVPDIVTSGLQTVGVRMPANPIALELIKKAACPIAAPSANKFGRISPTTAMHVIKQNIKADFIIDAGKTSVGIESTIIKLTDQGFKILRNGIITKEEIENIVPFDNFSDDKDMLAPGMLNSHYSPKKGFIIADQFNLESVKPNAGLISFSGKKEEGFKKVIRVSENEDLKEYAVNIFEAMHSFEDDSDIEIIYAEPVDEKGIGIAIMEKLRKASYNWQMHND